MGIAGGALMPLLYTTLKDKAGVSNQLSFLVCMLPAYLYILYYSIAGYKAGKRRVSSGSKKMAAVAS
jgi:fucose permease